MAEHEAALGRDEVDQQRATRGQLDGRLALVAKRAVGAVGEARDEAVERVTRNLPHVRTLRAEGLNVYDVLWASRLLVTRAALAAIEARLGVAAAEEEGA